MKKTALTYGIAIASIGFVVGWLEYQHAARFVSTGVYSLALAVVFTVLGVWMGRRLTPRIRAPTFAVNDAAIRSLGLTAREMAVLHEAAAGKTNKEIARALKVSPNTIKSHLASLYEKLDVSRRTQAIDRARSLSLIP